jgi:uncharacterized protein (TIGR00661 family)
VSALRDERLAAELEEFRPDGLLSDFEPFLPEAAARLGLPVVQLNHPGIVTRFARSEPGALVTRLVAARMMGRFDRLLLSSFYGGDLGPIIRPEILRAGRSAKGEDFILVYARDGLAERFRELAGRGRRERFRFFPNPAEDFPSALAACRAVVAPAGHQSLSEALFLRKPIFAVPLSGQLEQALNAEMLRRSGRGDWASAEDFEEPLFRFLAELDEYPRKADPSVRFRFRDDGPRAARIVESFFASEARRERRARPYARATWLLGRLAPAVAPA